jgi:hypothetical protein
MSSHFAPVIEAFHVAVNPHAHKISGNYHYENAGGIRETNAPSPPPQGMYAYDDKNKVVEIYKGTGWTPFTVGSLGSIPELKGILATNTNIAFAIKDITVDTLNDSFDSFLLATVSDYFTMSHSVNDYQEITSINNYVKTLQHDEFTRLSKLNDKFTNEVLSTKEMYLMANRDTYQIRSNIRLIMYSIVTLAILMALMPSNDTVWAKVLMGLVIIAFFVYAVLHVRNDRARRFKDFSKKFFSKGDLPDISKDAEEEKDKENGNSETCTD